MLMAGSFIIGKIWKQLRCRRMDKQTVVHPDNGILFNTEKK